MNQSRGSVLWFLFSYRGRISRIEFWVFHLALIALAFFGLIGLGLVFDPFLFGMGAVTVATEILVGYALIGLTVLAALSSLAVSAKRFHDRGKPGWWSLIGLVPIIGTIWVLLECGVRRGTSGPNRFGPDPLGGRREALTVIFD